MRQSSCQRLTRNVADRSTSTQSAKWPLLVLLAVASGQAAAADAGIAHAARAGDLDRIHALIASGADANVPEADGSTALLWAAYQSDPEMVASLLDAGADPNVPNRFGVTPLLQASRTGVAPVVALLLDHGASLDAATLEGETPLMAASRAGSVAAVERLLEQGSEANAAEDLEGQTALMWAAREGHLDVVDALLKAGADPNVQARVSELSERSTRTDFPTGGFTALMWAARSGDEPLVRRLVEGGADINLKNGDGASAMIMAIVNDRFDFAAALLDLGADPDDGSLYHAVLMRDATTDWLAKDGSRLRSDHPNELTALDLTRRLLEAGADPNKPYTGQLHSASMCCDTFENGSAFFRAAIAADVDALKVLLEHGGNLEWSPEKSEGGKGPGANANVGKTPLMVAMNGGKGVGMAGGPGDIREGRDPPFREAANREPLDAVRVLLEAGANPDAVTPDGDAALHFAAKDGKLEIIRALADAGATLDLANGKGETALEIVDKMPPREAPPLTGALAGFEQGAQPAEVAALLRELMGVDTPTQAKLD
jgi:uncharacterized protein